ncbi:serine/threonine-protein kinase [Streptomyces zagrosensis]|uniref:Outer membrane protein assembly factor BamB n=1 Tax=Streptomyces zagrosensis TaxID=1042984 RepID=A0A7W9QBF4_9ACTN|nr:serine/threonine-protein kinase [Streptomyces zagrosensis]MBB5936147.1 outer membrane protein assembly factor BamB [Streptomyces zagrosensis]
MQPLGLGDPLRLGPYRIAGVLGQGGMGKVYLGRDATGQAVAVKVLLPDLVNDGNLTERFVREAQTARAVTSDGVARVLGAQLESGRPWIATEFLAGPTLDDAVRRYGPFGDALIREVARSLASTLRDIHATGLVHRDLKPSNVVLTSGGPRIIDFGIARPEHGLTLTQTGQVPVTPGYGAPEQVLGRRVGPAADIFSLGAVLAFAATGRPPYSGAAVAALLYEVVHGTPDVELVPAPVRHLIEPCFAKDPVARPLPEWVADAAQPPHGSERLWTIGPLADEIRGLEAAARRLVGDEGPAGPRPGHAPDLPAGGARPARRRLLLALAGGGAVLAAGAGGVAWWLTDRSGGGGGGGARSNPFDVPPAVDVRPAQLGSDTGTPQPLWGPVQGVADAGSPPPLPVRDVVVFAAAGGGIAAHRVTDGTQRWRAGAAHAAAGYLSIADRLVVTADADGVLRTYVASTGEPKWTADVRASALLAADADHVYALTSEGALVCVATADAGVRWTRPPALPLPGGRPAAALGAGVLVVCGASGDVVAVRAKDGAKAWVRKGQAAAALAPAIDGGTVFLGGHTFAGVRAGDGKELWSREPLHTVRRGSYGWGPPTVAGGEVFTLDSEALRYLRPNGEDARPVSFVAGAAPPWQPPVVQANSVWVVESQGPGVSGLPRSTRSLAQSYPLTGGRGRTAAGSGNRLFVLNTETLLALPVF